MSSEISKNMSHNKNKRRKKILLLNTILVLAAYAITQIITLIAKLFHFSSVSYMEILFITSTTFCSTIVIFTIVKLKKTITDRFSNLVHFGQFFMWFFAYAAWIYTLREIRPVGLFFALMCIAFLLSNADILQSMFVVIVASIIQISVTYYAIAVMHQPGVLGRELFYVFCFLPAALFIAYLANVFKEHNNQIKEAKKVIEERNVEIQKTNEEVITVNKKLIEAKDALWGEMQLAKKIQTVLLPKQPFINNYEISTHMTPQDDVGGDYYDIFNVSGYNWLIIGDVSGHGVSSGLIMMMVQTSIHSILNQNPELLPSEVFSLVNNTIRHNIENLNEDKYMTLTILAAEKNGSFIFSGLHQDILLYRNERDTVEQVETEGLWIGIIDTIGSMLNNSTIKLDIGDVMLLFTDGITEAWRKGSIEEKRDPGKDMFGQQRLEEIFKQSGRKSTDEIKANILRSLADYEFRDDATLVILKRVE